MAYGVWNSVVIEDKGWEVTYRAVCKSCKAVEKTGPHKIFINQGGKHESHYWCPVCHAESDVVVAR